MTIADAVAPDRWTSPTWEARERHVGRGWRLSDWVADPLERAMIFALAITGMFLLWTLATADDATGMTAREACVMTAVDDARAFAAVMGDDRVMPLGFAERSCGRR